MSAFDEFSNKFSETEDVKVLSTLTAGISLTAGVPQSDTEVAKTVNEVNPLPDNSSHVKHNKNIASLTARQTQHLSAGISFQDPSLKM